MQHWVKKFQNAFRGIPAGVRGQSSFTVHFAFTAGVLVLAKMLQCQRWEWVILLLCIGVVLTAELFNSALEHLARGLCSEQNEQVGAALDIASAAVLVASIFSAIVGLMILGPRIVALLTNFL
ncbi:MAG: diacylglycerol kinase family protein [Aureliella sp.]